MTELIPGKLYIPKTTFWAIDSDSNTDKKISAGPLLILSYSISGNDLMNFKFLTKNKLYEAELFNNPSFFFQELT